MDVYRIGVSILATNGVSPVLATIGRGFTGLHGQATGIGSTIGGWGGALAGVAAILATGAIVKGLIAIGEAGGAVNHQLEMMKTAGMSVADIQNSMTQAMATSNHVLTTNLSENLQHIRELRYAFGDTTTAIEHLDEISKANSILNNIRGGKGKDEVWELVKALESKGETYDPKEFSSYVNTMTKVVQATGGKVTPQMFMGTFKYGRTATLGWSEEFIGGALPRLIQEYTSGKGGGGGSGGPGNALMSMYAKIVQEQMSKTAAFEFERMGLGHAEKIKGSAQARLTGMPGRDLFMANPYEWVQQVMMPALAAHGVTSKEDVLAQISKMFAVRTASDITAKMALQGRFLEGDKSPFEKDIALQKKPMGLPAYDELIKNDYPMIIEAFHTQWKNLMETLGSPMMQPGGPVIGALAGVTQAMGALAQAAVPVGEAIKVFTQVGGFLLGLGTSLLGFFANMTGLSAVFKGFAEVPWATISAGLESVRNALVQLAAWITNITAVFDKAMGLLSPKSLDPSTKEFSDALKQNQSFRFDPARDKPRATPISMSLNVDGRALAQTMSQQLDQYYEHATGAPSYDGSRRFLPSDGGMIGT